MKIKNSVALVTGANRGIGKALVEALIAAGASKVYVAARQINGLSFRSNHTEIVPIEIDICDSQKLTEIASKAADVNLLFNNAGVLDFGDILEVPLEKIQRNFDTNFYGTLAVSKSFAPVIKANEGGAIVNTLTLLSLASMPGLAAYNASKAAAWSLTLSLRASLAGSNIDVHSVFPGAVDTDMLDGVDMPKTSAVEVASEMIKGVAEDREDIFPDPMSVQVYQGWSNDHKAVEKQFAQM